MSRIYVYFKKNIDAHFLWVCIFALNLPDNSGIIKYAEIKYLETLFFYFFLHTTWLHKFPCFYMHKQKLANWSRKQDYCFIILNIYKFTLYCKTNILNVPKSEYFYLNLIKLLFATTGLSKQ